MKKIFLFAAAAMVSLSSCVQTEDVYTGGLNEMGFKSAVTRAIIDTTEFDGAISVSSVWDNPNDNAEYVEYFSNTKFALDGDVWRANPAKYWPTSGNMQFMALYPQEQTAVDITKNADGTFLIVKTKYSISNNIVDQHDVLFSDLLAVSAPQTSAQPLLFHHALAQLNVTLKKVTTGAEVVVNSVKVVGATMEGKLSVWPTQDAGTKEYSLLTKASWESSETVDRYFLDPNATAVENGTLDYKLEDATAKSPKPFLVIPSAQTQIVIEYTVDGKAQTYTHTLTGNWEMGYKYTYNYTINVNEILFDCTVDEWKPGVGGTITI